MTDAARINPHEDVVLIEVTKRRLDEDATADLVDAVHTAAVERPGVPIVMDLSQVKFAPSVALGALVKMGKSFDFDGRRLAMIGVDRRVRDTIRITRLDQILEIHRDLDAFLDAPPA